MEQKTILPTDKEAATFTKNISGWVSAKGHFYGNNKDSERLARWDGSTHKKCDCGEIISKTSYCSKCRAKKMDEKFNAMEKLPWDEETPVSIFDTDIYFGSMDELIDYCEEYGLKEQDLKLCHCVPSEPPYFDIFDFLCDIMPEDFRDEDMPANILAAADELNKAMSDAKPISWVPGNTAVSIGGK